MDRHDPIAVFDSGVGGVSVLRELRRLMPGEHYLYFGDSANAPYGLKSTDEVRRLTLDAAEQLFSLGAKCLVVACNTATDAAHGVSLTVLVDLEFVFAGGFFHHVHIGGFSPEPGLDGGADAANVGGVGHCNTAAKQHDGGDYSGDGPHNFMSCMLHGNFLQFNGLGGMKRRTHLFVSILIRHRSIPP